MNYYKNVNIDHNNKFIKHVMNCTGDNDKKTKFDEVIQVIIIIYQGMNYTNNHW